MRLFSKKLIPFYKWLDTSRDSSLLGLARKYCLLDAAQLDWRYFRDTLFDRKEANATFVKVYESNVLDEKKPLVTLHKDIDATYSMHRCFAVRHKTRMQLYRDDLSNKGKRLRMSVEIAETSVDNLANRIKAQE